jgi:alkylation response protein AidB-like acyl-CoA dehydrogenase
MYVDYTPSQKALRRELRAYLGELLTPELCEELGRTEGGGPLYRQALRKMGTDGWLGIGWPKDHGGQGRSAMDQFIFFDEVQRAGFPIPFLTLNTVGPTLMKYGTDAQRAAFLPGILRGEIHFAIGYTEPEAGTDLASLKTSAVRDGDVYVVNGQKVFTSLASYADYVWLAARTDPQAPKHQGISIFIVDVRLPGFSMAPTETLGDNQVCSTFYENVRVPASCLVGAENAGWKLITMQLNHERVALSSVGPVARLFTEVRDFARKVGTLDRPWVQHNLARVYARLEILKLMNWQQACAIESGALHPAEASAVKVFSSEFYLEAYRLLLEVLGPAGALKTGSPGALLQGRVERYYRATLVLTFGGGTNEVQREIIAATGLKMPRSR